MAGKFDTLKVLNGDLKVKTENSEKINFNFLKSIHRATNVTYQDHHVTRAQRGEILGKHPGFRGCTIWFTGLSGAGKTTIAFALEATLNELGIPAYGLDGDNMRHGVCTNLGFSAGDREENIRRVGEVSKLFADMGVVCLASFISPYAADRTRARHSHDAARLPFIEVYVNTPLNICEQRDSKGLYGKARAGLITGFTGIDSPFEPPVDPELTLYADRDSVAQCTQRVLEYMYEKGLLPERCVHQLLGSPVRELTLVASADEYGTTEADERTRCLAEAARLPQIEVDDVSREWAQVLAEGWASPLTGFMRERQYLQTLHFGKLLDTQRRCANADEEVNDEETIEPLTDMQDKLGDIFLSSDGISQSVPIVLPIFDGQKAHIADAKSITLVHQGEIVGILRNIEIYTHRKEERIARQFGVCSLYADGGHPTIDMIRRQGDWLVGGDLTALTDFRRNDGLDEFRLRPAQLRAEFDRIGADAVFAFQLRNPIHNGHALLMQDTHRRLLAAGYKRPVLLLHPLGGWTKDDDVPLAVRMRQHTACLSGGVLDAEWTVLAIFPSPMLYAGPTEVQWHARARLAAGVTHYIVGRDPAGINRPGTSEYLYEPTHGAKVLAMAPGLGRLQVLPFRVAAYDRRSKSMEFFDSKRADDFVFISGTKMRGFAKNGEQPPHGFMAPAAWEILADYYRNLQKTDK